MWNSALGILGLKRFPTLARITGIANSAVRLHPLSHGAVIHANKIEKEELDVLDAANAYEAEPANSRKTRR